MKTWIVDLIKANDVWVMKTFHGGDLSREQTTSLRVKLRLVQYLHSHALWRSTTITMYVYMYIAYRTFVLSTFCLFTINYSVINYLCSLYEIKLGTIGWSD